MKMADLKTPLLCLMFLLCGLQGGFIFKCWWDYKNGPVPMITPSDMYNLYSEKPNVE